MKTKKSSRKTTGRSARSGNLRARVSNFGSRRFELSPIRKLIFVLALANVGTLLALFALAATAGYVQSAENDQLSRIASHRQSHVGRSGLTTSGCMTEIARLQAKRMADRGGIYHNPNLGAEVDYACASGGSWTKLGENVGVGYTSSGLFTAFLGSAPHHANVDDADWNFKAVGAYQSSDGRLWMVQLYARCIGCGGAWTSAPRNVGDPSTPPPPPPPSTLTLASEPAAVSWGSNRIDVFARGTNGAVYHRPYDGQWHSWRSLGGGIIGAPAVSSWSSNRLDVFVRGTNNALYHKWWNGSWSGWENLGGTLSSAPAAVSWGNGRIDVFARGTGGDLIHKWYNGRWSGWESLGGNIVDMPTVASWGSGRLDVFARGPDNKLYQKYFNGRWSKWIRFSDGVITSSPGAVSWGSNRIDVFARGTDGAVYHKPFNGQWHSWRNLGGGIKGAPTVSSWAPNRLDVFVRGTNDSLYQKFWNGSWSGWIRL